MKSVFFLYILLFSTTIHAKVEVLCLGEGECVSVERNAVHPGALSGASTDQKLDYLEWYTDNPIDIDDNVINDIKTGSGDQEALLDILDNYIFQLNDQMDLGDSADDGGLTEAGVGEVFGEDEVVSPPDDSPYGDQYDPYYDPDADGSYAPPESDIYASKEVYDPYIDPAVIDPAVIDPAVGAGELTDADGGGDSATAAEMGEQEGGCFSKSWGPVEIFGGLGKGTWIMCTCDDVDNNFFKIPSSRAGANKAKYCRSATVYFRTDGVGGSGQVVAKGHEGDNYYTQCTPEGIQECISRSE